MKLKEYIQRILDTGGNLLSPHLDEKEYLRNTYFAGNQNYYDKLVAHTYGNLLLVDDDEQYIYDLIWGLIQSNDYKYSTLYKTINLEYNPIWNVDGTEVTTDEYGKGKSTQVNGERKDKTSNAAHADTTTHTSHIDSIVSSGYADVTSNSGGKTTSSYPFDTKSKTPVQAEDDNTSSTVDHGAKTDTYNYGTKDDTVNYGENNTSFTQGSQTNTNETDAKTDKHTLVRQGNIGVTSTQNLINQEREVADFNFIMAVMADIVQCITLPIYTFD